MKNAVPTLFYSYSKLPELPEILKHFQRIFIYKGNNGLSRDSHIPLDYKTTKTTESFYAGHVWRNKDCTLLYTKSGRCAACQKMINLFA